MRLLDSSVLLHGDAPLAATYLAAAGLRRILHTGDEPEVAGSDPSFELSPAPVDAEADLVLDLGDGAAFRAARGPALRAGARGRRVFVGVEPPREGGADAEAQALVEILAAGEALMRLLGAEPKVYDFEL